MDDGGPGGCLFPFLRMEGSFRQWAAALATIAALLIALTLFFSWVAW